MRLILLAVVLFIAGCAPRMISLKTLDGTEITYKECPVLYNTATGIKVRYLPDGSWEVDYARESDPNNAAIEAATRGTTRGFVEGLNIFKK